MMRRVLLGLAGVVVTLAVVLVVALLVVTQTDWGRERVRRYAEGALNERANGRVTIGRASGNLLTGITLDDVVIVDSAGAPFFRAERVSTRYSLRALFSRRIVLDQVRLVRPVIVLDKRPGAEWNYVRIFPTDTTLPDRRGFGSWVMLENVRIDAGHLQIRSEWQPSDTLAPAERRQALADALAGRTRDRIVRVPGGYQRLMDLRELYARLPRARIADPDSANVLVQVGSMRTLAELFHPPIAVVRDLAGTFRVGNDSLHAADLRVRLPATRLVGEGAYDFGADGMRLAVRADPMAFNDLRFLYPQLPEQGGGRLSLAVAQDTVRTSLDAREMELRVGASTVAGRLGVTIGDSLQLRDTDLRLARLDTRLVERLAPAVDFPRDGTIDGRIVLAGNPGALRVDGNLAFTEPRSGVSRVRATGEVGTGERLRLSELRLAFEPLQLELVRAFAPDLPLSGTVSGRATLDGTYPGDLRLDSDLTLRDRRTGLSRVRAAGGIFTGDTTRMRNLRVAFDPLQMEMVRAFSPDFPLQGYATGRATLDGVVSAMRLDGEVALHDPRSGVSRLSAAGFVGTGEEVRMRNLRVAFDPVQMEVLRAFSPDFPLQGYATGRATLDGVPSALRLDGEVALHDPRSGVSRLRAAGFVGTGESVRMRNLRLAFEPMQLGLVRSFRPDFDLDGTLAGRATLDGIYPGLLKVDGDLRLEERRSGTSRVLANGGVVLGRSVRFETLRLRFDPFQVELVRAVNGDFPLGGTLTGTTTLNGSPTGRLAATADLVHVEGGERSHVIGRGSRTAGARPRLDVDARLQPLSLATAGRFAPAAQLRGSASGTVRATGALNDLRLRTDLRFADGGTLAATGWVDLQSAAKGYDLTTTLGAFNLAAVTARGPRTLLTGSVLAEGRGTDPATLRARLVADLVGSAAGGLRADSVRLAASAANGLATLERAAVRLASADLRASGTFGLRPGSTGVLDYTLRVDSLSDFAGWLPPDSGAVPARPRLQAAAVEQARADSIRLARATEVERAATGQPAEPPLRVDTVRPIPRDTLAGRLFASGRVAGNLRRFDLTGEAEVEDLLARGNAVGAGRARYSWLAARTPQAVLDVEASARDLRAGGFALDSLAGTLRYRGDFAGGDPGGTVDLRAFQDPDRDYRARADFVLALDRRELRLAELQLRFDTTTWQSTRPGVVAWGRAGVEVENLELAGSNGGRIFADGRVPTEGSGDLQLQVRDFQVGDLIALLQDSTRATGLLSLDARVRGTRSDPVLEGDFGLVAATWQGREIPETRARFDYAGRSLGLNAQMTRAGRVLATAEGRLPVNLALTGVTGPRLLDAPLSLNVRADSLPVDLLPTFTDQIADVEGRAVGDLALRGTLSDPVLTGRVDLDLGRFRLVPSGVTYRDIAGTLRLDGDRVVVDSVVAHSRGTIRVAGEIDTRDLRQPGFDLRVDADGAQVLNNDRGKIFADADLLVRGPYDGVRVTGDAGIRSGVIYLPEQTNKRLVPLDDPAVNQVVDTAGIEAREVLPQTNPLLANLQVDVGLTIERDTWVRNTDANVEIYTPVDEGALRVKMDRRSNTLTLVGTVNTDRGEYTAMGRRLLVTRGSATFLGDTVLNPMVHMVAEHEVLLPGREALTMQIHVGGTLRAPTLSLESSAQPPISETDLLSYFAFGRQTGSLLQLTGSGLSGQAGGSGNLVGGVAALATRQLATVAIGSLVDELETGTARSLGLDVFRVTPADLPTELSSRGAESLLLGTEVEAGKYFRRRWFVAGQARPTFVRPGARLEYWTPRGFGWMLTYQPRFLPQDPSFSIPQDPRATGVLGSFVRWEWRF